MYRLVVWDFDGTLADSMPAGLHIFNRLAPELGIKPIADPAAARGMSTRQFLRHHRIRFWRLPRLVRRFQAAAAAEADKLALFPGLAEVLRGLVDRGVRLGILSSNNEGNIRRCLAANGVEGLFAFVVGCPKLFGKGRALRRLLRTGGVDRREVLYVGDEVRDLEAAKRAGVAAAAVTWGFHAEELLRAAGPRYVVSDPRELLAVAGGSRAAG
ncbi:MAG: HAD hydrolase-like protein [Gemmataceae bacterium]|nr:HAD hydrolase-like protein [Gemmataceae bacterium]